jgi:pyruvate,orthophosphate dikinase
MGVDSEHFERELTKLKEEKGVHLDVELSADDLKELVRRFKEINPDLPSDPHV